MKVLGVRYIFCSQVFVSRIKYGSNLFLNFSFFSKNCMLVVFSEFKIYSLIDRNVGRGREVVTAPLSHCNV